MEFRNLILASSVLLTAACTSDIAPTNNGDGKSGSGGPQFNVVEHEDGYQQGTVDASGEDWIYIDLETMTQVFPADPEADDVWDLAFEAAAIKVNGGESGTPPSAQQVYVYADKVADNQPYPWDNLSTAPTFNANTWHQDEPGSGDSGNPNDDGSEPTLAFATYPAPDQDPSVTICGDYGWYYYAFFCSTPNHEIVPRVNVAYVVRSTDCRYYRFRMTDYFSDTGLSKFPQFDAEEIPGDACNGVPGGDFEFPVIF